MGVWLAGWKDGWVDEWVDEWDGRLTVVVANPASASSGLAMKRPARIMMDFLTLKHIVENVVKMVGMKQLMS
jgi:hypothetical protein